MLWLEDFIYFYFNLDGRSVVVFILAIEALGLNLQLYDAVADVFL